jgi:Competence protein CoiA-like family
MDFAKDRRGKLIGTQEASPHLYYICPVCAADVFLRSGRKRVAHFAHRSGQGKKDCELFHPSDDISYTWTRYGEGPDNNWSGRPIEPLSLSIELEPEAAVRGKRKRGWGLRVTVPKADDEHGQVSIDCGTGQPRKIALSKLFLAAQTYPAHLDAQDFGAVWTSPEVRPNYKAAVEERIRGLDRELVNIFAASPQKYKPRVDRLNWGSSYYFVWRSDAIPDIHDRLPLNYLAEQSSWCCAFTSLPAGEDAELKSWLEEAAGAVVTAHRRTFGVLYPPPYGADLYGRILIPAVEGLVLGVHLTEDDQSSTRLGDASAGIALEGGRRHFVHVSSAQPLKLLRLSLDDAGLPPLLPLRLRDVDVYPVVRLSFRFHNRAGTEDVPLHKTRCAELMQGVRLGECEIASIEYPVGVKGTLRWRLKAEIAWNTLGFHVERRTGPARASVQQVASLNDVLQQREIEVEFDFGPFGRFSASIEHAVQRLSETRPIPGKLRNRALWLLRTAEIYADEQRVPLARLTDGELLALLAAAQVGPSLAAHKVSLNRDLSKHARGPKP